MREIRIAKNESVRPYLATRNCLLCVALQRLSSKSKAGLINWLRKGKLRPIMCHDVTEGSKV
jgi:hypothetical protein